MNEDDDATDMTELTVYKGRRFAESAKVASDQFLLP